MTHTPPIPAGNQSPYPLQEPPHAKTTAAPAPPPGDKRIARTPEPLALPTQTLVVIAAGVAAALAGGLFYAFSASRKPQPKRRKRKTAKA